MDTLNLTNGDIILEFIYLVSALLFVVGLKLLSSPDSARKGNLWAGGGMGLEAPEATEAPLAGLP